MIVIDGELRWFNKQIRGHVVAYDVYGCNCLYLTDDGKTHYIEVISNDSNPYTDEDFADGPDVLDLYLLKDQQYIFVYRDRLEVRTARSDLIKTYEMAIRPDFRLFKAFGSYNHMSHYLNGGIIYSLDGYRIRTMPDHKYILSVDSSTDNEVEICYVTHDDIQMWLSYGAPTQFGGLTKVISGDDIEVYTAPQCFIMYCPSTNRAIYRDYYYLTVELADCEFKTNGYQWTILEGQQKYYHCEADYHEVPIDSELAEAGHHIIRPVPVKSARF